MRFYISIICSLHLGNIHGFITPTIKPIIPTLDKQNDPTVSVVILPGTLVRPKCYEPLAREIHNITYVEKKTSTLTSHWRGLRLILGTDSR